MPFGVIIGVLHEWVWTNAFVWNGGCVFVWVNTDWKCWLSAPIYMPSQKYYMLRTLLFDVFSKASRVESERQTLCKKFLENM